MNNNFKNAMRSATNYTYTENGALTHQSTLNAVYDMFAMGAAMRKRSDEDILITFKNACAENINMALKCLFYIRDIRGGQGERRFFKTCLKWLADSEYYETIIASESELFFQEIIAIGRYDDLYAFVDTQMESLMFAYLFKTIKNDLHALKNDKPVSLCAKWLKSENTSSKESRELARKTRMAFGMTPRQYRVALSKLRKKIKIVETTMSQGDWNDIDFATLPSRAGFKYRNAFMNSEIIGDKYKEFISNKDTKVKADDLYPYEIIDKVPSLRCKKIDSNERKVLNKYWNNLNDYFNGCTFNGIAVVDTSGSMWGTPFNVASSLGIYCAEKNNGPFADCFITFSDKPKFITINKNLDIVDKVNIFYKNTEVANTNIEATFDIILNTAIKNNLNPNDIPENLIIISDMEFDEARDYPRVSEKTLIENIRYKWCMTKYKMPHLIFWNVDARQNNIPMSLEAGDVSYVSGFSPSIFSAILTGKSGLDLMYETIDKPRYDFKVAIY